MKRLFGIKPEERLSSFFFLLVILVCQYLIISKFWCLFANYTPDTFNQFLRNFHMSGFDPITYDVVTQWHEGYDILRHPLLALAMYPLFLLNKLLWTITGCNCVQIIIGVILTFCGFYSAVFLRRTMIEVVGIKPQFSTVLSVFFLGFAFVIVSIIVPDHFCLSLFCLTLTTYLAGKKIKANEQFSVSEAIILFILTAGITLSNGAVVLLIIFIVNGKSYFNWRFLLKTAVFPVFLLISSAVVQKYFSPELSEKKGNLVAEQMKWTHGKLPRGKILQENFFGESLQLHRKYVLGDVLNKRPIIVEYSWKAQDYVVILIEVLLLLGLAFAWKERFTLVLLAVLGFNIFLHIILAFAIDEVYIMAAHWAFVIPLAIANLFLVKQKWMVWLLLAVILSLTIYLYIYHGYLLHRYLTWPLVK